MFSNLAQFISTITGYFNKPPRGVDGSEGVTSTDVRQALIDVGTWADERATASEQNAALAASEVLNSKVDKVTGKGLSANDYTTTEKQKLGRVFDCLEFTTYAAAVAGLSGVAGRRLVYVIDDTANGNTNGGWYGWNGTALGELLWLD
ncbi:hypothetical protein [Runella slithyformis]|uniref:Uncharacterized protein n=1 Tax=Runella slithyformis (strain ATCC 29530 / DSM 19594 / LMG 11500 / NCIMB 11436 / LSU 4) TaxID=761193 RepID=A0A7U3ZGH1_RUNSL|nr:hypothetical protein [Runella slithyformis]AEI46770.1 hypothetical protein Runsl_0318 [Runella slithyformis DSM 19594]